jgi:hypothetical protein
VSGGLVSGGLVVGGLVSGVWCLVSGECMPPDGAAYDRIGDLVPLLIDLYDAASKMPTDRSTLRLARAMKSPHHAGSRNANRITVAWIAAAK